MVDDSENQNGDANGTKDWKSTMSDNNDSIEKKGRKRRFGRLGILGWTMVLLGAVIITGLGSLLYLVWSFQVASTEKAAQAEGLVPVTADFSSSREKKDDVLFRIAGRKRVAQKLMPDMVAAWMRTRGYSGVTATESRDVITVSGSKDGKTKRVLIAMGSAKGGFEAMIQSRVEGVVSLRAIETSEADRLSAYGDMNGPANEKVIGHDISFVYTNSSNPIENMNSETLGRILSGEITDWSEISDKKEGAINIKLEDMGADKNTSILTKILGDREIVETAKTLATPDDVVGAVSRDANAIGFSYKAGNMGGVKNIALNERNARTFEPDEFNIATEAYPFTERVYLYIGSSNGNQDLVDFASFALSPVGQEVVKRDGYGAQQLAAYAIKTPIGAPNNYAEFSKISRRMNFDFRFNQGTNELDNKAVMDLERFRTFVQKEAIDPKRIAIFGFADNVGAQATNMGLAQSRAEQVAKKLNEIGINPAIIRAYGDAMPVGANAYEAGRIKNRRVEVWVCPPPACPLVNLVVETATEQQAPVSDGIPAGVHLGKPPLTEGADAPKG